jgi:Predicted membrane protein.
MAIFTAILDLTRQELATRGNKLGKLDLLLWSIGLSIPLIVGYTFFLCLQSYALRLDVMLNVAALTYLSPQLLISLVLVISHFIDSAYFRF